ncbi:hypothetical protein [Thiocystis violacea]|uniref:hypothetical protein n=1 Tax=Thiocystis violacea TaxID=13725 RepID=UPI001906B9B7|nr:hypothetical protein [Thiocystis violacea]MBK1719234.1 hypothetical protein [Thiocystis violacea]
MILTRTDTSAALTLPDDWYWEDEHTWTPVEQSVEPSLTGAALIQESTRQYRPITLRPWSDVATWIDRATLATLATWSRLPGLTLTLAWMGTTRTVLWRYDSGKCLDVDPIDHAVDDSGTPPLPPVRVTLRFLQVEA